MFKAFFVCFYILLFTAAAAQTPGTTQPTDWKVADLQLLVRTYWGKVSNIEYRYEAMVSAVSLPTFRNVQETVLRWDRANDWERRENFYGGSSYPATESSPADARNAQGWNGKIHQCFDARGLSTAGDGRVVSQAQRPGFGGEEPLEFLELRVGEGPLSLVTDLDSKDVMIEGQELVDGHNTVVVSVNYDSTHRRSDSLFCRYWLDPKAGGMPRRIELWLRGKLVRISWNVDIAEVLPGFYFPLSYELRMMGGGNDPIFKSGAVTEFKVDRHSIRLNPGFKQEDYAVIFENGTEVLDEDTNHLYEAGISPAGKDVDWTELKTAATQALLVYDENESARNPAEQRVAAPLHATMSNAPAAAETGNIVSKLIFPGAIVFAFAAASATALMIARRWRKS